MDSCIPFGTGIAGGLCGSFFGAPVITAGIAGGLLAGYLLPKIIGSLGMQRYNPHAYDLDGLLLHNNEKQKSSTQNRSKTGYNQGYKDPDDKDKKTDEHPRIFENNAEHMFRKKEGHITDTPANRELIERMVADKKNLLGKDGRCNEWFAQTLSDGQQLWASVRGKSIRNCGINKTPHSFNPQTGLCKYLGKN